MEDVFDIDTGAAEGRHVIPGPSWSEEANRLLDINGIRCPPPIPTDHILIFWKQFKPEAAQYEDRLQYIGNMIVPKFVPISHALPSIRKHIGLDPTTHLKVEECTSPADAVKSFGENLG